MGKYIVQVTESRVWDFEVEADDADDASITISEALGNSPAEEFDNAWLVSVEYQSFEVSEKE
jgi:hypothetical protein